MAASKPIPAARPFEADERQREAIEHVHGPMLVVAGAGTGKTTVLTRRIAELIQQGDARPDEILAVTYTDNAAREMQDRVRAEIRGTDVSRLQITTFHAYCNNLLIRSGKQFGVLDDKDLWIYLRKRLRELNLKYFVRAANVTKFLDDLLDFLRRCQDELVGPEKYASYVGQLARGALPVPRVCKTKDANLLSDEEVLGRCQEIADVFSTVERMLGEENLGTFGHMITRAHQLLAKDEALLGREREHARFILVDEFQDANFAQVKILQKLAGEESNVFAVGDPDQAIFRFRGASSAAFGLFQHQFPAAKLVVLEKNRRSTTPILRCAYALISKNPETFPGSNIAAFPYKRSPLTSAREEDALREGKELKSALVETVLLTAKELECSDLVAAIRQQQKQSRCKWKDFAVLYRQHSHRDDLVEELAEQGIPFTIENMDVMDTAEARDLFACLGAVVSTRDDASLFRVAALPQFAIDPEKLRSGIKSIPRQQKDSGVGSVLAQIDGGPAVLASLQKVRDEITQTAAKSLAALNIIIRSFGFDRSSPPLASILDFVNKWEQKPTTKTAEIGELLEYLEYFQEAHGAIPLPSTDDDAVRLMTAHAAKGLEFNHVFILRANSNSFPCSFKESLVEFPRELRDPDSISQQDDKTLNEQEERRLFYVAMTRARDSLTIYARRGKGKDASPPGFMRDLVKDAPLKRYLRERPARGFQTDLFGEAGTETLTRIAEWLSLAPASDLSAKLSASAVQRYEVCPLQFKLEREWKIPGEVPAAMQYGATMHRVLRAYYDSVRFQRPMSQDALVTFFRADLDEAGIQDHYQYQLYDAQGIEQLQDFLAACRRLRVPEVLHTEEFFEVRIGAAVVVGRIDRIDKLPDGRVVITDYKTGKPQSQEDADDSLQLSIYALAAREKWGYRAGHLALYNLGENTTVITERTDAQLHEAQLKVESVAASIAAGNFDPKPSFNCRFCAYRSLCPATEKRLYTISVDGESRSRN